MNRKLCDLAVAAATVVLARGEALAQSCAMCRSVVQSAGDPLARGINLSVLFMVSMPFAIVASIGGWVGYTYWRARRASLPPGGAAAAGARTAETTREGRS